MTTELGRMVDDGKLVIMNGDGISELTNYFLAVDERDKKMVHARTEGTSLEVIITAVLDTAHSAEVPDEVLLAYIAAAMAAGKE